MHRSRSRRRGIAAAAVVLVAAGALTFAPAAGAAVTEEPWTDTSLPADERAQLLVDVLTLDEKVDLLIQTGGPGLPQYGVPAIRGKDASNGLTNPGGSTALPVGLALASSWNEELAFEYGTVAGRETREAGYNSSASPSLDLARTPWNGRIWESFGEDPYLTGALAAEQTAGIQSQDIPAEAKHYNVYHAESRRGHVDVVVDERTLQEVYSRPWEPLVRDADLASVMCSFNKVNGEYACGNETLLTDILKEQFGFQGFVQTDFDAGHEFSDYAAGLDTSGEQLIISGDALRAALADGRVSEERITDAARRVLWTMFEFGIIDNPPVNSFVSPNPGAAEISSATLAAGDEVATVAGEQGTVLLKNDATLPLDASEIGSIAVIGADADHYIDGGGSASVWTPTDVTTMLQGITERAGGDIDVQYAAGTDPIGIGDTLPGPAPIPSDVLQDVVASYRMGVNNTGGDAFFSREESQINLRTGLSADTDNNTSQIPGVGFPLVLAPMTVVYHATLVAPTSGTYTLALTGLGTASLTLDGESVLTNEATEFTTSTVDVDLTEGEPVEVVVEYTTDAPNQFDGSLNDQPGAMVRLGWVTPDDAVNPMVAEAAELAAESDVAIVVARDYTGEAGDRGSLSLPQDQDGLIESVVAANPRTIVVLATGGASTMPWIDDVPAVVQAWYGGQVQGETIAKILFGDVNPSGKLPITFPASDEQAVAAGTSNPFDYVEELWPVVEYTEGIDIGYRSYVKEGIEPLFDFGHGLSYTDFAYGALDLPVVDAGSDSVVAGTATVTVTNTGATAGTEIVQLYVGELPTDLDTADRALAGFARVELAAGESREVEVPIDRRSLQYWDVDEDEWVTPVGDVPVVVGSSSSDIRTDGTLRVSVEDVTPEPTTEPTPEPTTEPTTDPAPEPTDGASDGSDEPATDGELTDGELTDDARGGLVVSPTAAAPGDDVTGALPGAADTDVAVWLHSSPTEVATVTTDADGGFTFTVPLDAEPGEHRVVVLDAAGDLLGWAPLDVTAPAPATAGTLSPTGGVVGGGIAIAGAAAVIAGLMLMMLRRRRAGQPTQ